jgi:cytochrome P450
MQLATEMTLPTIPVENPDFDQNPMTYIDAARREHPWLAKCALGFFVHGYHANRDMLVMDEQLRTAGDGVARFYGAENTPWARFMSEMLIHNHGSEHDRIRASVEAAFTPRAINRFRELIKQVITELLDEWTPKRNFDFTEMASFFPIRIMCALLGTSYEAVNKIREALDIQVASMSLIPGMLPDILRAHDVLWNFADEIIKEREASGPANDGLLLDALVEARKTGKIDDVEIRFMLMFLFPAGYDTTKNMLSTTVRVLMDFPEYWERCAKDRAFVTKVVEEMLRHSGITCQLRLAEKDCDYEGVRFPKGSMLIFTSLGAGRDPNVYENPADFNPDRVVAHRQISFGRGTHNCMGQHLARALVEEGLHAITQRIRNPKAAGEILRRPFLGISGLRALPIQFEPAPLAAE